MCTDVHTHTHTHTMSNQIQSQCTYALHTALDAQKWRKPNCVTIANCHSSLIFFVQTYAPDAQQLKWCWCRTQQCGIKQSSNHTNQLYDSLHKITTNFHRPCHNTSHVSHVCTTHTNKTLSHEHQTSCNYQYLRLHRRQTKHRKIHKEMVRHSR